MGFAGNILISSLTVLISLYADKYKRADFEKFLPDDPINLNLPVKETFDFIIVGGGTAGCVLANRLSEHFTVLVLEAGGNPPPIQSVPYVVPYTMNLPGINFLYKTTPQPNAKLENSGIIITSTGKMLGGTSSHHGMTYERGNPKDYDRWADSTKDSSWKYDNLLPLFRKMEGYMGHRDFSLETHGRTGLLKTDDEDFSIGTDLWIEAGRELGYEWQDSNAYQKEGVTSSIFTKNKGRRESSYTAFVKPIENKRKSLTIYRYSLVSEVLFENNKAIGVKFTRHGVPSAAFVRKEVILSAGSHISPVILIKSGIGPEDELKKLNLTPLRILPVGHNLMDHPLIRLPISVENPIYSWSADSLTYEQVDNYIRNGKGPLSASTQGSAGAFITSATRKNSERNWPDIQLYYTPFGLDLNTAGILVGINEMESRGRITVNASAESMEDDNLPITDLNFFGEDIDFETGIDGILAALKFIETKAFKAIGAKFAPFPFEDCKDMEFLSREYIKCYIRQKADTTWHGSGTCKMGLKDDPTAVVDSKLKVIGIENLRVVDASVMPSVPNANTATPTMVIAEKAAIDILNEHGAQCDTCDASDKQQ